MSELIQKGSVAFWLISLVLLISFFVFVPLPHYHHDQGWFTGPSIGARIMGEQSYAAPVDKVVASYLESSVNSPFDLSCSTDLDCTVNNIRNQCQSYCASNNAANPEIISKLEKNRVCDPAFWQPEFQNCRCVFEKCINIEY